MDEAFDAICELVLASEDPTRMVEFYERLGLKVLSREADRVWLAVGTRGRIGIWTPGEKEHRDRGGDHVHFALSTARERFERLVDDLEATDPDFEGPVVHDGGDRSIYVFDPEGNRVELWDYFRDGEGAESGVEGLEQASG
jgi:catechol-2,3-dioxygenase